MKTIFSTIILLTTMTSAYADVTRPIGPQTPRNNPIGPIPYPSYTSTPRPTFTPVPFPEPRPIPNPRPTFSPTPRPTFSPTPRPTFTPVPIPEPRPFPNPVPIPYPTNAPAPRSNVVGELVTITDRGEVLGWGCNLTSRAALEINVYLNDRKVSQLKPIANLNIRQDARMGLPERACGELSGFKFSIPNEYLNGRDLSIELTGNDVYSREEIRLEGSTIFKTPLAIIDYKTLFEHNTKIYYSNGVNAFCYIGNPDQLSLFYRDRLKITEFVNELPFGMRNDGTCVARPYPRNLFMTETTGLTVFYSNGQSAFCAIPFPGMLNHISATTGLSFDKADHYKAIPTVETKMQNHGICKAEGLFRIGIDIYYSNGTDAFCHLTSESQIGGRPVFQYEAFPPQMRNDGDCK